jgi:hypothetical protein
MLSQESHRRLHVIDQSGKGTAGPISCGSADPSLVIDQGRYAPLGKEVTVETVLLATVWTRAVDKHDGRVRAFSRRQVEGSRKGDLASCEGDVLLLIATG